MSKTLQDWLAWQETLHPCEIDLGLQRVAQVIRQLLPDYYESPHHESKQTHFPCYVITIAGTNGKGSTVALLEAILCAAGYQVGSYTSPHLLDYNERIKINQIPVADKLICDSFERINLARGELSLSYFEFGTLAAIDIIIQQNCDIAILEVGLGGRLDAVNVIDPDIALVTTVDIDHQDWLGHDRETIALEKAGIYRPDKPALYGDTDLPQSIKDKVKEEGLFFYQFATDYNFYIDTQGNWQWHNNNCTSLKHLPSPNLNGYIQYKNASNVLMILELLKPKFSVSLTEIQQGLQSVKLAGRFQKISDNPLIILDVAHNEQATKILKQSLENTLNFEHLHIIIGMLKDKECAKVIAILEPIVDSWRIIELNSNRAKPAAEIADIIHKNHTKKSNITKNVQIFSSFKQAFDDYQDKQLVSHQHCLLIFGSFYTVKDALTLLGQHKSNE